MKALASTGSILCATLLFVVLKAYRFIPDNLPYAPFQSAPPGFLPILSASTRSFVSHLVAFAISPRCPDASPSTIHS